MNLSTSAADISDRRGLRPFIQLAFFFSNFTFQFVKRKILKYFISLSGSDGCLLAIRLYFRFARWNIQAGQAKRKIEPDTILLRNVYRPRFWLIDIQQNSQSKFLLLARSSVCKFPITAIRKKSRKCRQNKKIIGYDISSRHKHSNLHDCWLEGSGIVHGCSVWAETEWKFKTRQGCHVPKYAACLNPFPFQVVSGNILFAFVTDFLRKKPWAIKRNTFSFIL